MRFATALLAFACAACWADTLTLRDGKVVQGTYMGGTARTIKMQVDDEVKTYDVTDVAKLQFTAPAASKDLTGEVKPARSLRPAAVHPPAHI